MGQQKLAQQNYQEAEELLRNAIRFDPQLLAAYEELALTYIHQGKFKEALSVLEEFLEHQQPIQIRLQYAGLLLILERAKEAQQVFEAILQDEPDNFKAGKGLGDSYFRQNNFKMAQQVYNQLLDQHPNDPFLWFSKAEALYRAQDHEAALSAIERAIQLEAAPEFFAFKGDFFIRHDNYERALEQYRLAANLDPRNAEIQLRLGFISRILDRPYDALDAFDNALEIDPYLTEALSNKIELLTDLNQPQAALAVREQLVRLHPDNLKQAMNLIHHYMDHKGYERAGQLLELVLDHHEDNSEVWYALAYCMKQLGELERGLVAIKRTIQLEGEEQEYLELRDDIEKSLRKTN